MCQNHVSKVESSHVNLFLALIFTDLCIGMQGPHLDIPPGQGSCADRCKTPNARSARHHLLQGEQCRVTRRCHRIAHFPLKIDWSVLGFFEDFEAVFEMFNFDPLIKLQPCYRHSSSWPFVISKRPSSDSVINLPAFKIVLCLLYLESCFLIYRLDWNHCLVLHGPQVRESCARDVLKMILRYMIHDW